MNDKRSAESDGFSDMGIPLAGGTDDGSAGPSDDEPSDGEPGPEPLGFDGVVGDVTDGLRPISHAVYEAPDGVGLSLLIENTGRRAFEHVEARVRLDGGDTMEELTATSEAGLDRLGPGDQWRFWIPIGGEARDASAAATRYTIDLRAT